uniref:Uncharacterized protein LOC111133105 n=1 Tax=Crassostrea virginica TaxID=6565 RepID=A0A8B8EBM1_CRAVI|nr:uncharacterized protein LOC111133105 [Crassostrea virginica]
MISTTEQISVKAASNTPSYTYPVSGNILFFLSGSICTVLIAVGFIFLKSRLRNVREFYISKFNLRNNDRNYINAVHEELAGSVYHEIDGQRLGNLPDAPIPTPLSGVVNNTFNPENSDVATCCENAETSDGRIHNTNTDYQMSSL